MSSLAIKQRVCVLFNWVFCAPRTVLGIGNQLILLNIEWMEICPRHLLTGKSFKTIISTLCKTIYIYFFMYICIKRCLERCLLKWFTMVIFKWWDFWTFWFSFSVLFYSVRLCFHNEHVFFKTYIFLKKLNKSQIHFFFVLNSSKTLSNYFSKESILNLFTNVFLKQRQ